MSEYTRMCQNKQDSKYQGPIQTSNLGVGRVMRSLRSIRGATMVGAEGQNFQNR